MYINCYFSAMCVYNEKDAKTFKTFETVNFI